MESKAQHQPTLYLLCGKMAAGKSTFAGAFSQQHDTLLLSEDEWLGALYPGEITDIKAYVNRSGRLKAALESLLVQLLARGHSIVLDFPANTIKQRAWLVNLAKSAQVDHKLFYLDVPDDICKTQLNKRAVEQPERAATDTPEMFDALAPYFEPPGESEALNVERIVP